MMPGPDQQGNIRDQGLLPLMIYSITLQPHNLLLIIPILATIGECQNTT